MHLDSVSQLQVMHIKASVSSGRGNQVYVNMWTSIYVICVREKSMKRTTLISAFAFLSHLAILQLHNIPNLAWKTELLKENSILHLHMLVVSYLVQNLQSNNTVRITKNE